MTLNKKLSHRQHIKTHKTRTDSLEAEQKNTEVEATGGDLNLISTWFIVIIKNLCYENNVCFQV